MIQLIGRGVHYGTYNGTYKVEGIECTLNDDDHLIPIQEVPDGYLGWMYDGVVADIGHERLYKVHTRAETQEEYDMLSS